LSFRIKIKDDLNGLRWKGILESKMACLNSKTSHHNNLEVQMYIWEQKGLIRVALENKWTLLRSSPRSLSKGSWGFIFQHVIARTCLIGYG
jgi:hypothetical protein